MEDWISKMRANRLRGDPHWAADALLKLEAVRQGSGLTWANNFMRSLASQMSDEARSRANALLSELEKFVATDLDATRLAIRADEIWDDGHCVQDLFTVGISHLYHALGEQQRRDAARYNSAVLSAVNVADRAMGSKDSNFVDALEAFELVRLATYSQPRG